MFENKKVLVIGMARSGLSVAKLLKSQGALVTINDSKTLDQVQDVLVGLMDVAHDFGGAPKNILTYDFLVMSPGVPTSLPFVLEAKHAGIPVLGALEVAYRYAKGNFYGITGTNGKTSTTTLTYDIFKAADKDAYAVGNIGNPLADHVLDATDQTHFITEVSSFQLESIDQFKVHIAAILNLAPDHLNRHKTMEAYVDAKKRLYENQNSEDYLVLNYDDQPTRQLDTSGLKGKKVFFSKGSLKEGICVENDRIVAKFEGTVDIMAVADIKVPGQHNLENVLAAVAIAYLAGIEVEAIRLAVMAFGGVEHRIEYIGTYQGLLCYNDSKGTNPESSIVGVNSMSRPTLLIAGGMDKGSVFETFVKTFKGKVKHLILLGETKELIRDTALANDFQDITLVNTMDEAVNKAFEIGVEGDAILLSPACASWDMYPSFEVRGEHFKSCVMKHSR